MNIEGQKIKLYNLALKFIEDNDISCEELIIDLDQGKVIDFIEKICEVVGYYEE